MEKMLINTYGATMADAMAAKDADGRKPHADPQERQGGGLAGTAGICRSAGVGDLQHRNWLSLLGRVNFITPLLLRHPRQ